MKNSEICAAYINLNQIISKNEKYPVSFSYALKKNLMGLEPLNKAFEEERNKLLDEYNVKDDHGEPAYKNTGKIEISEEHQEAWKNEMEELLAIEVDYQPHKIEISDLPKEIEASVLCVLDFMINE